MKRACKAEVEQDLDASSPARVIEARRPQPIDPALHASLIFFFKQRDRHRQTDRQSRSAHRACVGGRLETHRSNAT